MNKSSLTLPKSVSILFFSFLVIFGLYFAREFLIPISISALLAMLFVPLSNWLENKGISRLFAGVFCVLLFLLCVASVIGLLAWQAKGISNDLHEIIFRIEQIADNIREFIARNIGISSEKQKQWMSKQTTGTSGTLGLAGVLLSSVMNIIVHFILVIVYLFLFIYYRSHLKKFILMLVPASANPEAEKIILDSGKVAQKYLSGLSSMIVILWIMYSVGFSIAGVKSAIFFAILCGLLEILPFIGNLTGTFITVLAVMSQGGSDGMIIGVVITYLLIQFIQTYFLEPLIVGSEVNINPLFTILIIVFMEIVWGISGMILAIPMLGIVKIICDHVTPLKPYGFLIGRSRSDKKQGIHRKLQNWLGLNN